MGKYLMLWELNPALIPVDPKERATGYAGLMVGVQQDIEAGISKDWGSFVGTGKGYCVVEGSEVEIAGMVQKYSPYCKFETFPVATVEQMNELFKSMIG
jgi:hypothetical protein